MAVRKNRPKVVTSGKKTKRGSFSSISNNLQKWLQIIKLWIIRGLIFFFVSSLLMVILYRFVPVPITPLMVIRVIEQLGSGKEIKMKKDWASYEECGHIPLAAVAGEDAQFLEHHGFDFEAITNALKYNKKHKRIKGGSTISQQTAKNVFLWPGRNWVRKGIETYFTILIELLWSKERILEVYVNVIEMGDGIYGAEAASLKYFKKPAKNLTKTEAAAIISILPSPRKWSVTKPTNFVQKKQRWIRRNMNVIGKLNFD